MSFDTMEIAIYVYLSVILLAIFKWKEGQSSQVIYMNT